MRHISYQDKVTELYEMHKEAIQDKLDVAVDHGYQLAVLLGKIDDEKLLDELNYHLAKILENIEDV